MDMGEFNTNIINIKPLRCALPHFLLPFSSSLPLFLRVFLLTSERDNFFLPAGAVDGPFLHLVLNKL